MSDWIGFSKERTTHTVAPGVVFWPFIPKGSDLCARCGELFRYEGLLYVHSYEDGTPIYFCPPCLSVMEHHA